MNKSNKILSVLISVLIVISGANLLVGIGNTYRIRQLENAPAVVIEEYLNETDAAAFAETTDETTTLQTVTESETISETYASLPAQDETTADSVSSTEAETSKEEKTTAATTIEAAAESSPANSNSEFCFVTDSGTKYHKEGCSYLKKSKTKMTVKEAKSSGYTPCSRCY